MKTFIKVACVVPVAFALAPVALEQAQTAEAATLPTFHLHSDVRIVTFSQPIDPASLKDITLFDETQNEIVKTVAQIGNNPKQVKISLAVNEQYEDRHVYSLTLKGIKSATKQKAMALKELDFKMVEQAPKEVAFTKSYVITNIANTVQQYELPAGASYVTYDEYGGHTTSQQSAVQLTAPTNVTLKANERMTVSFFTNATLASKEGFTIVPTTNPSHTVYVLQKSSSIEITGQDELLQTKVHFGNASQPTTASYAAYNTKGEVVSFKHDIRNESGFTFDQLKTTNDVVITNEDYAPLYVYAPKTVYNLTSVSQTQEDAVAAHELQRYEIVQANTTEPAYNTELEYDVAEGAWRISGVSYKQNNVMTTLYKERIALPVYSEGDTLIKNEVGIPLTVTGPGRYVTFTETTEQPLHVETLLPAQKIKVSSALEAHYDTYLYATDEQPTFSNIHVTDDIVQAAALNKALTATQAFVVGNKHTNIIENTSAQNVTFYAAKRPTVIEPFTEQLFTTFKLAPNEEITVGSKKETNVFLQDETKTGAYELKQGSNLANISFEYTTNQRVKLANNETITIKNTGPIALTLYARNGDVSYTK